jgi:hypothetical protein
VRLGEDRLPCEAADLDEPQEHLKPVERGMPYSAIISIS